MNFVTATCAKVVAWLDTTVDDWIIDAHRQREMYMLRQRTQYLKLATLGLWATAIAVVVSASGSDGWQMAMLIAIACGLGLAGCGTGSLWNRLRNAVWWS